MYIMYMYTFTCMNIKKATTNNTKHQTIAYNQNTTNNKKQKYKIDIDSICVYVLDSIYVYL